MATMTVATITKPSDFINLLEDPDAPAMSNHDDAAKALLSLLAHTYFADGRLDEGELAQMRRLSGMEDILPFLQELQKVPLDVAKLGELYPDAKDRDDIITLVEHAVWGDNEPDDKEWDIIDKLVEGLGVVRA